MKEFNFINFFAVIKKRKGMIFIIAFLTVMLAGAISYYALTPIYENSTQILVNQERLGNGTISNQNIEADLQLVNTYSVIIKSKRIMDKVIEQLSLNTTVNALNENMTVISASNSQVIEITVRNPDPKTAMDIANTTATVFEQEIQQLMNVNNVSILSTAGLSDSPTPVAPNHILNLAISAVIGLALGIGMSFMLEYVNTTINTENDIEELLEVPLLAVISPIPNRKLSKEDLQVIFNE
ncbi:YveK family protein [Planococcus sp. X10-3]|uniref:YveK family protein n=1 Tax=Planococcus sp. X10-3 TaxID=3061240 RepID=UPI003BB01C94